MTDDSKFDPVIESVAEGEPVDWELVEAGVESAEQRTQVRALRDVARVAEFHQRLQQESRPGADPGDLGRWGELLLLERVGAGADGEVFRAWDTTLQREVALKLMRPRQPGAGEPTRWLEEARALARLRDPHVVTVFGAAEHEARAGLWMEFLHGPTLEHELARRGPLPAHEVAGLGAQLGRALRAVHASATVHRDVKPANIVLESDGRAVLTDFGLGQRPSVERDPAPFSGTPLYMSPQRLAGAAAKPTDDLYALGVTLFCALAGEPPYRAETLEQLRAAVAAGARRPLRAVRPDAPVRLTDAIERAMASDPRERFADAAALAAEFEAAGAASRTPAPSTLRARAGLGLAVLLVALIAAWVATQRAPRRAPPAAVAPASVAYDVSAGFLRHGRDGRVHLESGDRVAPGDRVSLEFRSTREVWVYVLDADERGENYLLFPQPMFDRGNPVPGDSTVLLPGTRDGRENAWTVTSRGGREHLLVVATPEPLPELEAELRRLPAPVPGHPIQYARVESSTMDRLRGMAGLSEIETGGTPQRPALLFEHIRSLAGGEQAVRGTWVRQVVLENPLR